MRTVVLMSQQAVQHLHCSLPLLLVSLLSILVILLMAQQTITHLYPLGIAESLIGTWAAGYLALQTSTSQLECLLEWVTQ